MPTSAADLPLHKRMLLQDADPELFAILSGAPLPPALEAQVLTGSLPAVKTAPTAEELRNAEVASILSRGNPMMPGGNVTDRLRLLLLDPQAAGQARSLAEPYWELDRQNAAVEAQQKEQSLQQGRNEFINSLAVGAARASLGV